MKTSRKGLHYLFMLLDNILTKAFAQFLSHSLAANGGQVDIRCRQDGPDSLIDGLHRLRIHDHPAVLSVLMRKWLQGCQGIGAGETIV